ncbi:hypothetical protein U875_04975 [Pandoraea pnomenusa 3kgm]|nr:hypothetical protein U875_04975 [Pandoraea pnomenusa 3kgm]AHB78380.1 hypothetical protein X636_04465 [Pandoraea pnomenusa]
MSGIALQFERLGDKRLSSVFRDMRGSRRLTWNHVDSMRCASNFAPNIRFNENEFLLRAQLDGVGIGALMLASSETAAKLV